MRSFLKGFGIGLCIGFFLLFILFGYLYITDRKNTSAPDTAKTEESSDAEPAENTELPENTEPTAKEPEEPTENVPSSDDSADDAETETEMPPDEPVSLEAVLAFTGDILFSDPYLLAYDQSGIQAIADSEMLSHMQGADLLIVNQEFPFSLRGEPMEDKQFTFRTDPKYVKIFQDLGVDIASVANNHSLDYGRDAFCDSLDTLANADIACIGGGYNITEASAPAIRTVNGQTFAVFGATRVSPSYDWYATDSQAGLFQTYDPAKLNAAILEASQTYDHVIVFVHWGVEKSEIPEDYQRTLAQGYIEAGADLIVGCHPHVLQGFEYYNGVPIIYSLGNYLFSNQTGETLLLEAVFSKEGAPGIRLIPCRRVNGILTRIQEPAVLFQKLTELSFGVTVSADGTLIP